MYRIALDAMGGDNAPAVIVAGAVQAVLEFDHDFEIVLAGPEDLIQEELNKQNYNGSKISIHNAPALVAMDDAPTEVLKSKGNSGLVTCVTLQKEGLADASISAGNSGAMMGS